MQKYNTYKITTVDWKNKKENLADNKYKLSEKIKKLENEFRVKNSQLVILELYLFILQILS